MIKVLKITTLLSMVALVMVFTTACGPAAPRNLHIAQGSILTWAPVPDPNIFFIVTWSAAGGEQRHIVNGNTFSLRARPGLTGTAGVTVTIRVQSAARTIRLGMEETSYGGTSTVRYTIGGHL